MTDGDPAHSNSDGKSVDGREDEREKSSSHKAAISQGQSDLSGSQKQIGNSENSENEEKAEPNEESGDEEENEKAGSEAQSYWDEEDDLQALLDEVKQRQDDRQQKRGTMTLESYWLFSWLFILKCTSTQMHDDLILIATRTIICFISSVWHVRVCR